ncbi:ATP-binding protein [Streptomyces sp. NPDC048142]|uniref:ATP-binding protein n=1 Tax=Streptomyces sp. NPDC048142 TaxID=3365501 RepID=UPI003713CFF8
MVTGANGTGKSSFAEAAEMALTGFNARWDGSNGGKPRTKIWRRGWCNLHEATAPQVAVSLTLDDSAEPVTVRRTWFGAEVEEARTTVIREDGTELKLDECVNADMLDVYRPFLPYSELGSMVDGTMSDLYRKISTFIGLGRLGEMDVRLADRIKECKDVEARPRPLKAAAVEALTGLDDRRAVDAMAALGGRVPDADAVRSLLDQDAVADQGDAARLRARASLTGPDETEVAGALGRLREAMAALEDVRHSDAEAARRLAALLEAAFEQRRRSGSPHCPVGRGDPGRDRAASGGGGRGRCRTPYSRRRQARRARPGAARSRPAADGGFRAGGAVARVVALPEPHGPRRTGRVRRTPRAQAGGCLPPVRRGGGASADRP